MHMSFIIMIIVGGLIGWIAGAIVGKDIPGGIIGNIVAGLIGSAIGSRLLGTWGPVWGGVPIFPALIGSIVFIFIASLIISVIRKKLVRTIDIQKVRKNFYYNG